MKSEAEKAKKPILASILSDLHLDSCRFTDYMFTNTNQDSPHPTSKGIKW